MSEHTAALMEIYGRAPALGEDVSFLIAKRALMHIHVRGRDGVEAEGDECLVCGLDLRNPIHARDPVLGVSLEKNKP